MLIMFILTLFTHHIYSYICTISILTIVAPYDHIILTTCRGCAMHCYFRERERINWKNIIEGNKNDFFWTYYYNKNKNGNNSQVENITKSRSSVYTCTRNYYSVLVDTRQMIFIVPETRRRCFEAITYFKFLISYSKAPDDIYIDPYIRCD